MFNSPFDIFTVKEKVGIGTDNPTERLEVKGNIRLNAGVAVGEFSNDGTLAIVNDRSVPTTQSVKTYVDNQIATANIALANKADKSGSPNQDFQANSLKVKGNLEVTGTTTFRNIEQHQGDVTLGNEDTDRTIIRGVLESTHSSGALQINSPLSLNSSLNVNGNGNINNTFLGDVGHGATYAGFSHKSSVGQTSYALLQSNDGLYTLLNKKSGGGYMGFRIDNVDKMSINDAGQVSIASNLNFGASTRQMIDLWNKEYGIGVQNLTTYFRSFSNFSWFSGGVHNNATNNPGGGGVRLMSLNGSGDLCLSARTNPTGNPSGSLCRALVDGGNKLIINFGGDYSSGVEIFNGRFTSSREYKENIVDLSTQEATIALKDLNPVKFSYKTDRTENLHLGFIAEDVPDLLAAPDKKSIGSLDVVAVLTKVVQDQQTTIATLIDRLNVLEAKQA